MKNLEAMTATPAEFRMKLPIPYVMEAYGYKPVSQSSGRLLYSNPWREDKNPSLDVFVGDNGEMRAGDYAENFNGSVTDVIQRELEKRGELSDDRAVFNEARRLLGDFLNSPGWEGPSLDTTKGPLRLNMATVGDILSSAVVTNHSRIAGQLIEAKPGLTLEGLATFEVRPYGDLLVFPYPDHQAFTMRSEDGTKTQLSGGTKSLYHVPGLVPGEKILLVEGETDTIAAHISEHGQTYDVIGVPGVGEQPGKYLDLFEGKEVIIAFDGDKAGREGAARWSATLTGNDCSVSIIPMPPGTDVAGLEPEAFTRLLDLRRVLARNNSGMESMADGYYIPGRKEGEYKALSNWTLRPVRVLEISDSDEPRAYEVEATVSGEIVKGKTFTLTNEDMSTPARLHNWCARFSGSWYVGGSDHQRLRAVLEEAATFLPVDTSVRRPGLVAGSYVYPGGTIGPASTILLPDPQSPLSEESAFCLTPGESDGPATVNKLLAMHDPSVMRTLLAWLAIAPLRSKYKQFPPLFVTGRAGSGKTTVIAESLRTMSGVTFVTNLTSTTPYALTLTMGSTNSFPTWFDEYRPGAGKSTTSMMNQLLRDAYNAAPSRRGGMGADKSKVTIINTNNPLLVSGEDFADEQSHRDRLIKVFIPVEGRGVLPVWDELDEAFGADYLLWLTESVINKPPAVHSATSEDGISSRPAYNVGVIRAGWNLLQKYVFERSDGRVSLDTESFDWLIDVAVENTGADHVLDNLRALYEIQEFDNGTFARNGASTSEILISPTMAMAGLSKNNFAMPFTSAEALKQYLVKDLGGEEIRKRGVDGKNRRYVAVAVEWDL